LRLGAWILRFAGGYTRRANSVNPLGAPAGDLSEAIETSESHFRERGLRTVFKLTRESQPPELEGVLHERGYELAAPTRVMTLSLSTFHGATDSGLELWPRTRDDWLDAFSIWQSLEAQKAHHREILDRILLPHRFATLRDPNGPLAVGLVVHDGELAGLFDVVTAPAFRRLGHGENLVRGMLAWAQGAGARTAYLQVQEANASAFGLYTKLGFREIYRYWYRAAP
jgi:ribosomal protein S18 acetylase RimI-like enzyme